MIKTVLSNPFLRVPFLFGAAAGAIAGVAGGYWAIYQVVTFIGN
ncbi:MAG TPA: hypothetical protein VM598_13130 [Bdellovibrionota bacterium]|jgi:hypothetical protein|nr:hypothetical protein [Bdellovibrionota bacterium]